MHQWVEVGMATELAHYLVLNDATSKDLVLYRWAIERLMGWNFMMLQGDSGDLMASLQVGH